MAAGTVNLPAHQLIDWIHRINPTGQELSRKAMEERYRQKCALQNQLISRYKEEIQVVPDPNQPDIVAIHYRGRDACHAPLSELAVDVRAWVQRYLDDHRLEDDASAVPIATEKPQWEARTAPVDSNQSDSQTEKVANKSIGELLESGRKAVESYDFEAARRLFRTATERAVGEPAAAAAYLAFLVDTMGDYTAALEVGETLSRKVGSAVDVRELLGLAAARAGKSALAESYLKRSTGSRAAEAYRTLCADAVTAQELERAEYFLQEARQREDGQSGETSRLSEAIDALRRRLRQPLEQALEQLFAAGELEHAAESAKRCLEQWPDSRVARSILDEIEDRRTQEKIRVLIARAREAVQRHAYADALEDFQRALGLGCSPEALGDDWRLAQRETEKQKEREQLEKLRRRLTDPDPTEGLLAYLASKSSLRVQLRAERDLPLLQWLERMGAAASGSKARLAVNSVLALQQALEALERGSVEHAANLLSSHEKVIADLPEAQQAWKTIEQMRSEARHTAAHEVLAHARQALQAGRSEAAARLLEKLDQRALSPLEKKQVADWLRDLRQQEEHRTLRKRIDSLLGDGELLAARRLLDQLIEVAAEQDDRALSDERRQLTEQIDRAWRISLELAPDPTRLFLLLDFFCFAEETNSWLLPGGDGMIVAHSIGHAVVVCLVDAVAGAVLRHTLIAVPGRWDGPVESIVHGDRVSLIGAEGDLLELALRSWSILRHDPLQRFVSHDERIEKVFYCPGERFCWIDSSEGRGSFHVRIIDLERGREHRSFSGVRMRPTPVVGAHGLFLVKDYAAATVSFYTSSGKRLYDCSVLGDHTIVGAVLYESKGAIAVISYESDDDENYRPLTVSIVDRQGAVSLQYEVTGSHAESASALAVLGSSGHIFVLYRSDQGRQLLALKLSSRRLDPVYDVAIAGDAVLVCDETMTQVKLVVTAIDHPVRVVSLGAERPILDAGEGKGALRIPRLAPPFPLCSTFYSPVASAADLPAHIASTADSNLLTWVEKRVEQYRYHAEKLTGLVRGLLDAKCNAVIRKAVANQLKKGTAELLWVYATVLLDKECWDEAIRILRPGLPAAHDWTPHEQGHVAHLLGIAWYRSGRIEEALAVWESAGSLNFCELQPYIDLAESFVRHKEDGRTTLEEKLLRLLVQRLQEADRQLQADNYRAAIQALDCPLVWAAKEAQSLARLVFSLVKEESATPQDNFIRLMAVSFLLQITDFSGALGLGLPQLYFPGEWSQERIDAVVEQARVWWNSQVVRI